MKNKQIRVRCWIDIKSWDMADEMNTADESLL